MKKEEVESSEKNKRYVTKMMTLPLACVASGKRIPYREWVRSNCRTENRGIQKEEDELRLDSWIQKQSTG